MVSRLKDGKDFAPITLGVDAAVDEVQQPEAVAMASRSLKLVEPLAPISIALAVLDSQEVKAATWQSKPEGVVSV